MKVSSPVSLHTRHGMSAHISSWWRDDTQTLHVTTQCGVSMDMRTLLYILNDTNPTVNGVWEWNSFSKRISEIEYGCVHLC
jgi:hypothetical protein